MTTVSTKGWPDTLVAIAEVLGPARTIEFANAAGHGGAVYVPNHPGPNHPWRAILSPDEMGAMVKAFRGTRVVVPRGTYINPKKDQIVRLLREGELSALEIAKRVGCSLRHVRRVFRAEVSE